VLVHVMRLRTYYHHTRGKDRFIFACGDELHTGKVPEPFVGTCGRRNLLTASHTLAISISHTLPLNYHLFGTHSGTLLRLFGVLCENMFEQEKRMQEIAYVVA
jgi:hypothetical protein